MNKFLSSTHFLYQQLHSIEDKENTLCRIGEQKKSIIYALTLNQLKEDDFGFFLYYVRYSTLLHLPPLRFYLCRRMSDSQKL
jgi:hypothetical protein